MDHFSRAIDITLKLEGEYTNNIQDPGGETKFGISKKAHPELDISRLTRTDAETLYKRNYWNPLKCDSIAWPMCLYLFDMGVNSGNMQAIKTLQKTLNIEVDGFVGLQTVDTANRASQDTISRYLTARVFFYQSLSSYAHFGKGWIKRLFELQRLSLES